MSRQVQQNLTTTASDGTVAAVFPGGVRMFAVDDSYTGNALDRRIAWLRQADGSFVATIGAERFSNGEDLNILLANHSLPAGAAINAAIVSPVNPAAAQALVTILDSKDSSDFFRVAAAGSGTVGGGGGTTVVNPWGGLGFTLPHYARTLAIGINVSAFMPGISGPGNSSWQLVVDGVARANSNFFFNLTDTHQTLGWCIAVLSNLAAGFHTFSTQNLGPMSVDANDHCSYIILA